jgi:nanoRNase/pAp phosphatase (c-di-AMP/oligoRNAs hydrolase)
VGHALVDVDEPPPFAGSFFLTQDADGDETAVFSLRSSDRGVDVGEIAKSFEYKGRTGGGHRNAAGFSVPLSALFEGLK